MRRRAAGTVPLVKSADRSSAPDSASASTRTRPVGSQRRRRAAARAPRAPCAGRAAAAESANASPRTKRVTSPAHRRAAVCARLDKPAAGTQGKAPKTTACASIRSTRARSPKPRHARGRALRVRCVDPRETGVPASASTRPIRATCRCPRLAAATARPVNCAGRRAAVTTARACGRPRPAPSHNRRPAAARAAPGSAPTSAGHARAVESSIDRQHFRVRRAIAVEQLGRRWPPDGERGTSALSAPRAAPPCPP